MIIVIKSEEEIIAITLITTSKWGKPFLNSEMNGFNK